MRVHLDVHQVWFPPGRHLVFDQGAAARTVELPENRVVVDETFRIADQGIGRGNRVLLANAVRLVVVAEAPQLGPAFGGTIESKIVGSP